jgi:hypothetical protein
VTAYASQPSCSQLQVSIVHAFVAHARLQKTRLPCRMASSRFTVHVQLAQAHFIREERLTAAAAG